MQEEDILAAEITFFSKDDCPRCVGVKAKLTKFGVPMTVRNISHDEEAFDLCKANAVSSAPAVRVGDEWFRSPTTILAWAKQFAAEQ